MFSQYVKITTIILLMYKLTEFNNILICGYMVAIIGAFIMIAGFASMGTKLRENGIYRTNYNSADLGYCILNIIERNIFGYIWLVELVICAMIGIHIYWNYMVISKGIVMVGLYIDIIAIFACKYLIKLIKCCKILYKHINERNNGVELV